MKVPTVNVDTGGVRAVPQRGRAQLGADRAAVSRRTERRGVQLGDERAPPSPYHGVTTRRAQKPILHEPVKRGERDQPRAALERRRKPLLERGGEPDRGVARRRRI
jgi:hypothetical protein